MRSTARLLVVVVLELSAVFAFALAADAGQEDEPVPELIENDAADAEGTVDDGDDGQQDESDDDPESIDESHEEVQELVAHRPTTPGDDDRSVARSAAPLLAVLGLGIVLADGVTLVRDRRRRRFL